MKKTIIMGIVLAALAAGQSKAADPVMLENEVPVAPAVVDGIGIWGALAYSDADGKYGMFWGGDTRAEAEDNAMRHCQNDKGASCKLVETFRNHRHWNDDDGQYPYNQCAVLAVDHKGGKWGSATATSIKEARAGALSKCEGASCKVVEQGCT